VTSTTFDPFSLTPDYRRVVRLDDSALSPFRKPETRAAQAATIAAAKHTGPNTQTVLARFQSLGLTGVIPSKGKRPGLIILGGEIYHEGQELLSRDARGRAVIPIVPECHVLLRSVTAQALAISIDRTGATDMPTLKAEIGLLDFYQR
jgi:hypothetical protein